MNRLNSYKKELITGVVISLLLYFFLKFLMPLVTPFLLAYLTIYSLYPFLYRMENKCKLNKTVVSSVILFLLAGIIIALVWILIFVVGNNLGLLYEKVEILIENIERSIQNAAVLVEKRLNLDGPVLEDYLRLQIENGQDALLKAALPDMMFSSLAYMKRVLPFFVFTGIYFVAVILFSKDFDRMMEGVHRVGALDAVMDVVGKLLHTIYTYVRAQTVIIIINSIICCLGLWLIKVPFAFLLGILAGVLDALPFIGTGIILVPTAIIGLLSGNVMQTVVCLIIYVLCVGVRELLEPKLMGKQLGIYPVILLLSIYAGVQLFGVSGIIKGPLGIVMFKQLFHHILPSKS